MSKRYPEEEIERGLIAAATLGVRPAGRETGIPESTLRGWIDQYPARYAEIRAQQAPKWRARAAAAFADIIEALTDVEWDLLRRLKEEVPRLQGKDAANALKSVGIDKGINTDKANVLRGMPSGTVHHDVDISLLNKAIHAYEHALENEGVELEPGVDGLLEATRPESSDEL
jgi:hypothetical protein